MLYAKIITIGVGHHTSASDAQTVVCGDKFEFQYDEEGKAILIIEKAGFSETLYLLGDAWVMNESGRTISQFAVPTSHLQVQDA